MIIRTFIRTVWREPDRYLGGRVDPYMLRWWVIPRNPFFNIYLHKFIRSDDDRALHSHPWISLGMIVRGEYIEHVPLDHEKWINKGDRETRKILRRPFQVVFRNKDSIHRIELIKAVNFREFKDYETGSIFRYQSGEYLKPVWTIFITGPLVQDWGFWCPFGYRSHKEFLSENSKESLVGRGCE